MGNSNLRLSFLPESQAQSGTWHVNHNVSMSRGDVDAFGSHGYQVIHEGQNGGTAPRIIVRGPPQNTHLPRMRTTSVWPYPYLELVHSRMTSLIH